jgi:hypothetical protein
VTRGGKRALIAADEEQALRERGMPIRCCDYWPECSHVLAWYEERRLLDFLAEPPTEQVPGAGQIGC